MSTPEGKVKDMVKRALARLTIPVYPGFSVPAVYSFMPVQNGMGAPGLDFYLCINGYFVAIETKAQGKRPTGRQEITMGQINEAKGLTLVVDDKESLDIAIMTICNHCRVEYGKDST